jgi:hypothetical protein
MGQTARLVELDLRAKRRQEAMRVPLAVFPMALHGDTRYAPGAGVIKRRPGLFDCRRSAQSAPIHCPDAVLKLPYNLVLAWVIQLLNAILELCFQPATAGI